MELLQESLAFLWELKIFPFIGAVMGVSFVIVGSLVLSITMLTFRLFFDIVKSTQINVLSGDYQVKDYSLGNTFVRWARYTKIFAQKPLLLRQWQNLSGRNIEP